MPKDEAAEQTSRISWLGLLIWLLAALFFLYEFFLRTVIGSTAAQIIPSLHLTPESFALLGTAYAIGYGGMQVPVGILADRFGIKKTLGTAALVCALAALLFAASQGALSAFLARVLMGGASAFAFLSLLVIVFTWFPRRYFGFFAGLSQLFGTVGPLLAGGPLVALMLATHLSWRSVLTGVAGLGLVLALFIFIFVKDKSKTHPRKLAGLADQESLKVRLLSLIRNPQVWFTASYSGLNYVSIALLGVVWGTEYLQANGFSQQAAATTISLAWIGYAIGCPLLGMASDLMKRRKPALIFCSLLGLLITSLFVYLPFSKHWVYDILLFSLGVAAAGQNVGFATIIEHVGPRVKATALGINNGMISVFDAFTPALAGLLIMHVTQGSAAHLKASDFTWGLSLMPLYHFLSLLIAVFLIKETYCRSHEVIKR